jgi:hypothetical protein
VAVAFAAALAGCSGSPAAVPGRPAGASRPPSSSVASSPAVPGSTSTTAPSAPAPGPGPARPCGTAPGPPARYQHVVWIWMENHTWGSVIGSPAAPYLSGLARACGTDRDDASVGSPSLPNYLGATSGSTQGVTDDGDPSEHSFAVDNLFRQVRAAGGTERSFVESMPGDCFLVSEDSYAAKHNPAVYYDGPGDRSACQADDVPLSDLSAVLSSGQLPTYTSITPNVCDDMHDCSVSVGDAWLATWVPRILDSDSYRSGTTALFIVWDEPTPVADVVVAPAVRPGTSSSVAVDHYSLLRATEEMLGLPLLGRAASATSLRSVFGI